ncbi:hypothetical protein C5B42_01040 [Candidatus Cerribacteria bacterium 'Amazon FNV 2010 28 9']|uniref:Glycosyltransferase n=1 Tax=Candidatus Cerribacteria bacterium 'Amazon FNV 2010 28 9' TaxID=2081795 RepID=A0A317JR64_9BACT|nr:MAG: hypothetical protein C5B42_01040 [Candidatus Cerribacteria bacterium 'Amazon FNV 2010 28 9']
MIDDDKNGSVNEIFGIPFFSGTKLQLLSVVEELIESQRKKPIIIFTPNPEQVRLALHNKQFYHCLLQSTYNLPDGSGIVWALKKREKKRGRVGEKRNEKISFSRIPGREVFHELLSVAKEKKYRVFLIGGKQGSVDQVVEKWRMQGTWLSDPGAEDIRHEQTSERERVLSKLQLYRPHMVFVAYGAPWQEQWIIQNGEALERSGVKLAMVVGGSFEYEAGIARSVPHWIERFHLEWMYRLIQEPWRWKRQLVGLEFFLHVFCS